MINRWVEDDGLLDTLEGLGVGSIVFSPLAQGMLTDKYLGGIPEDEPRRAGQVAAPGLPQRAARSPTSARSTRSPSRRGQTLAQMALAWVLRKGRVTTALIGASRPEQIEDCVGALEEPRLQRRRARRDRQICARRRHQSVGGLVRARRPAQRK